MITAKESFLDEHNMPKSYWRQLLKEWIPERNADIFDRAYLEDVSYEQVAAEYELSVRQVFNISQKVEKRIVGIHYCN